MMKHLKLLIFSLLTITAFGQNTKKDSLALVKEKRKFIADYNNGNYSVFQIDSIPNNGILINKGWKYKLADNLTWANPNFNDKDWDSTEINQTFKDFPKLGVSEIAWFRKKIKVDSSIINQPLILSIIINGAAEIYLDGKLLHKIGVVSTNPDNEITKNIIKKHPYSITFDKTGEHLIAIRYSAAQYHTLFDNLNIVPLNIKLRQLNNFNKEVIDDLFTPTLISGLIVGIFLMMSFIHFFFYKFFDKKRYNLLFSISMLFFGFHIFMSQSVGNLDDLSIYLYLKFFLKFAFIFIHVILLIAVYEYLQQPKKILFWVAIVTFIVSNLFIFFGILTGGYYYLVIYSLLILNYIFLIRQSVKEKKQEGNALKKAGFIFLIICVVVFVVMIIFTSIVASLGKYNSTNDYMIIFVSIFLILIQVGPQFSISAATSYTLAKQFVKISNSLVEKLKEVETLSEEKQHILSTQNELLENQVKQRTIELEKSLVDLKATQNQLIQSEKLASLGELTAGIAHEIQNPLNFVNNFSELSVDLVKDLNDEIEKPAIDSEYVKELMGDLSQNQEKINHHGKRASSIVKGMLEHSRTSTGVKELTDINKLADEYLRLSYHGLRAKDKDFNADFSTDFDENLPKINVIPQDIGRVLLNLINNAFYAVNETNRKNTEVGSFKPTVTVFTQQIDNQILIKIKDNGIGMPESVKAKIFQPFFTTKPTGEGTGLGLSLAYDIVTKGHGGSIDCESVEGAGTTFIVKLPV